MKTINKFTSVIDKICTGVSVVLLLFICVAIVAQIVVRKLGGTLVWVDEMTRYAFVWMVMFGTVVEARTGDHITITSFVEMLPDKLQKIVNIVIYIVVTAFSAVLTYAYIIAISNYKGVKFSVVTAIPMSAHYVLVSILMAVITIASLLHVMDIIVSLKEGGEKQ